MLSKERRRRISNDYIINDWRIDGTTLKQAQGIEIERIGAQPVKPAIGIIPKHLTPCCSTRDDPLLHRGSLVQVSDAQEGRSERGEQHEAAAGPRRSLLNERGEDVSRNDAAEGAADHGEVRDWRGLGVAKLLELFKEAVGIGFDTAGGF